MKTNHTTPYDFILRNYREPKTDDPVKKYLTHPETARVICAALNANGMPWAELEDGLQDVYVKALTAFREKAVPVPADLRAMKAYCATIAKNHAIDLLRKAEEDGEDVVEDCENLDELTPLEYGVTRERDPVDAGRQLEVLAQLFREHRMPADGVDILEGFAAGCTLKEIGADLKITLWAVRGRIDTMHKVFRERMKELGLLASAKPLRLIVSAPRAIETLRKAA
jgi:RNA polymerase sigma factor (sigma-70 family)